ncbi:hypothetical protein NCCP2495_10930 [Dietzia sp. NCCP-2495]|uniref:MaoC/PaaZ C-terminal domain-containing protein n=1 Tax=Dietzia sp. NCCP-2495 TaxID=2934675 RepID=UPI00223142B7|nr:MaoC/PaaZ C-terminal domain-containing protein [Dietzia sp. NCCP-2495]GLB63215.1 hypothetical protein NCCP2495_10930 [Dietzia sp. NCCP-2495]
MTDTLYADDLTPGQEIPLGHYTLTEEAIVDFARQWDPITIHTGPADDSPLGSVIASGIQTLAVYQRLAAQAFWTRFPSGIGRGFEMTFRRPVLPGTTLTGQITIRSIEPRPDRGDAKLVIDAALVGDDGQTVLDVTNSSVMPLRPH